MQPAKMQKSTLNSVKTFILRRRARNDYDVSSAFQSVPIQTETFPDQPCKPMPDYAVSYSFADGNPDSDIVSVRLQYIHDKILVGI